MKNFNPACIKAFFALLFIQGLILDSMAQCAGNAVQFDGVDDYINVGEKQSLQVKGQLTIEGWIYPLGDGSLETYGGIIVNKEGEYEIARFTDGTIQFALANTTPYWDWVNTGFIAPLQKWTHIALTYSSSERLMRFYANSTEVFSQKGTGVIGDFTSSYNDFRIGGRQSESQYFNGKIEEVRVWNKALSATTIKKWYKKSLQNSHPDINNLIGYWKLDEGAGTTAADESSNANDGTLINGAAWAISNAPINKLAAKITADTPDLCVNDSAILTATKGIDYTYQWKKGNNIIAGATKRKYVAKSPGSYKVIITNSCGESKESEAVKVIDSCAVLNTFENSSATSLKQQPSKVQVYPNPATGETNITYNAFNQSKGSLKILNGQGKVMMLQSLLSVKGMNTYKINLEKIPAGVLLY
jgi:hypothetical protein